MRTTIELSTEHHERLRALARRRGERGFSSVVEEALDVYFASLGTDEVEALLALEGSITDEEADRVSERVEEIRASWQPAS